MNDLRIGLFCWLVGLIIKVLPDNEEGRIWVDAIREGNDRSMMLSKSREGIS